MALLGCKGADAQDGGPAKSTVQRVLKFGVSDVGANQCAHTLLRGGVL